VKIISLLTLATFACAASTLATAEDSYAASSAAVPSIVSSVCQNCHGPEGNSVSSTFPRLNGQQAAYIAAQLKNFRDHKRSDPHARAYMWGMASQLDDSTIEAVAKYFAAQKPTEPQKGGALASEGEEIFMKGVDAQNIPACAACHGDHGEGNDVIPRIAGQHSYYLKEQLEAFRSTLRESDIMHANTKEMTDRQIEALVSYLAND
jgi:cytochrome c553